MKSFNITYSNSNNNKTYILGANKDNIGDARELAWKPSMFNRAVEIMDCWDDEVRVSVVEA